MAEDPFDSLSPPQQKTIVELVNQPSIRKAAEAAGVGERTIYTWMRDPTFQSEYRRALRQNFAQAMSLAQRLAPSAINTLARVMADPESPHSAKVSASTALLKFSRESIELDDLAERVAAIEQQVTDTTKGANG
jgi:hypothetical protein